jgi:hypothetical protein
MKTITLHQAVFVSLVFLLFLFAGCDRQVPDTGTGSTGDKNAPLKATPQELPTWLSGQETTITLEPMISGGSGYYACRLNNPATLPEGLTLETYCAISGTIVLAPGTTRKTFPPFTVIVTDYSEPPQEVNLTITLSAVSEGPTLDTMYDLECVQDEECDVLVAKATGGNPPYSFTANSFAGDAPPLGMTISVDGHLKGKAPEEGSFTVGVCVADLTRTSNCGSSYLTVQPKGTKIPYMNVTVTKVGEGTVKSADGAIDCGTTCTAAFKAGPYSGAILKATWDNTTTYFLKWEGCTWGYEDCHVDLSEPRSIKAIFNRLPFVTIDEAKCERLSFDQGYTEASPYYATYKITATGTVAADYPDDGMTIRIGGGSGYGSRASSKKMLFCPGWTFGADMAGWGCHGTDEPFTGVVHWRYEEELRPNGEIGKYYLHASITRSFDENASYLPPIEAKEYLPCPGIQDSNEIQ